MSPAEVTIERSHTPYPGSTRATRRQAGLTFGRILGEPIAWRLLGPWPALALGYESTALIGIHGLGSDSRDLLPVARQVNVPTVLVDLPGFGLSCRTRRAHPVPRNAAVCAALLDRLGVERAVWWGCSYGGHVALRAARDLPDRVAALALTAPGGLDPDPPAGLEAYFRFERLQARSLGEVDANLKALIAQPNPETERYADRRLALHGTPPRPGGNDYPAVAAAARGSLRDGVAHELHLVEQPVELARGEHDPLVPAGLIDRAARLLPRADVTHLSGLGHVPWLEAPGAVSAQVRRAIRRANPARRADSL